MPSNPIDIAHLLRRSRFAALPDEITVLSALDWADAVEAVLDTSAAAPSNVGTPNLDSSRGSYQRFTDMVHFWLGALRAEPTVPLGRVGQLRQPDAQRVAPAGDD